MRICTIQTCPIAGAPGAEVSGIDLPGNLSAATINEYHGYRRILHWVSLTNLQLI